MKVNRLFISTILLIAIVLSFSGCNHNKLVAGVDITNFDPNTQSHYARMSYTEFSGKKNLEFEVEENVTYILNVSIETNAGSLGIIIKNKSGFVAYEGNDIPTSSFTVEISEPGKYSIDIKAKKHNGGYTFDLKPKIGE